MGASYSSGEEYWSETRTYMRAWRGVLAAILVAFFFYSHAIRYEHTYDKDCATPGMLFSQVWSWNFVLQAFYGFFMIGLLWISGEMLTEWYSWKPYVAFIVWNALTLLWLTATIIYLTVEGTRSNGTGSNGNVFNDFRICGVYGGLPAFQNECRITGAYNPGLLESELGWNGPRIFQYVFHWLFWVMAVFSMAYVPSAYKKSQLEMGKTVSGVTDDSDQTGNNNDMNEPLLSATDTSPSAPDEQDLLAQLLGNNAHAHARAVANGRQTKQQRRGNRWLRSYLK